MHAQAACSWDHLPVEIKFSIVELLDTPHDVKAFSRVSKQAYTLAVPALWRVVDLTSVEAVHSYLGNVPPSYHRYIRQLSICTKFAATGPASGSDDHTLVSQQCSQLLSQCTQLEQLTLNLATSLDQAVIPCFSALHALRVLSINHCGDEQTNPLSERLVVSIAASVPNLKELSLDRISRSALHAPELVGVYPYIPVVKGDESIPAHPLLGSELSLPSLLRLPTLKKLRIRDTHLGDPKWAVTPICCSLEFLDLGSCYHESQDFNRVCTERIVGNVGQSVDEFSLNTAISAETYAFEKPKETPLKKLRKIHLTPLFPVENVVDTLTTLSGSPVEELSIRCHEDDVADMCTALQDFMTLCDERKESEFYKRLSNIKVSTVSDINDCGVPFAGDGQSFLAPCIDIPADPSVAIPRLQEYYESICSSDSCGPESTCSA
ncbi:uncharacterized protein PHACADRAFT_247651 [Phanerochaete carnosa HHB-10118-sp]|uniref:F-box domain-containing protein n=1 Tax=Phanerochaete carnosa (strain HHB-10118-sp) TaxID=650164 RepID=K5WB59_PHACS|nr:uncharacterized protein PHACADRAFT_247651 [Phanerochaete carnosa HHB-10118-sp]EKM61198.1 hypothetical protein PHACADRAFT_247651 [Phanerochaete carnosa HHB-10118-sp]